MSAIIPQSRQKTVIQCPYDEILYGGAAGAGKTYLLPLDWLAHWREYGRWAQGVLFRNTNNELVDIRQKMVEIFQGIKYKWDGETKTFHFSDGATLKLSYLDGIEDAFKHKGFAYTWRAHDELTQRPTDEDFVYLESRMRSPAGVRCRTLCTSNPDGPGHLWVKKRYRIDMHPNGNVPFHTYTDIEARRLLTEDEGKAYDKLTNDALPPNIRRKTRIFIPGRLSDNKYYYEDGMYLAQLLGLPEAQRKMLLDGDWNVVEGAFFSEWNPAFHTIKAFTPPSDWKRWMAGDWGMSSPYCFLWFCESPQGDRFIYRELYGCLPPPKEREGTRESPVTVAEKIRAIEAEAEEYISERYLDASCFDNSESMACVAEQFRQKGVVFQRSEKKFKSGSIGIFRDHLKVVNGHCRLKIMDNCVHTIRTVPALMVNRTNVEQYDTDGEDHAADAILYGLRKNLQTKEELARATGLFLYNKRLSRRFGAYGMR